VLKAVIAIGLLAVSASVSADGPGSRIRIGPPEPQRTPPATQRDLERCERLRDEAKDRCVREARAAAAADEKTRGPGSVGGTPAGTGATSGSSGGGTFGGTAPR
jgi:hypothetical protein